MDRSGSVVAPGQKFLKIWRMRNEGSAPWSEHTALSFVGGDLLGAPKAVLVGSVAPGAEVDLSVEMVAPRYLFPSLSLTFLLPSFTHLPTLLSLFYIYLLPHYSLLLCFFLYIHSFSYSPPLSLFSLLIFPSSSIFSY